MANAKCTLKAHQVLVQSHLRGAELGNLKLECPAVALLACPEIPPLSETVSSFITKSGSADLLVLQLNKHFSCPKTAVSIGDLKRRTIKQAVGKSHFMSDVLLKRLFIAARHHQCPDKQGVPSTDGFGNSSKSSCLSEILPYRYWDR